MLYAESFISPFIKIPEFPIKFRIKDEYAPKGRIFSALITFNPGFIQKINESKFVKKFLLSKEYKEAEALFNLSKYKKEFEDLFNTVEHSEIWVDTHTRNLLTDVDFSQCFPFNCKTIDANRLIEINRIVKNGSFLIIWIKKTENKEHFLGAFQNSSFYITRQTMKLLVINSITKLSLPHVSKNYISKVLSSYYADLKHKYITIVRLSDQLFSTKYSLENFVKRFVEQFIIYRQNFSDEYEFFMRPTPYSLNRKSPPIIYNVINEYNHGMIIALWFGIDAYIMIYSNEYPFESEIVKKFKDSSDYFADGLAVLETKMT
jgi:hypothetical protein